MVKMIQEGGNQLNPLYLAGVSGNKVECASDHERRDAMSITGHVIDGKIVLDSPVSLPNGTAVRIELLKNGDAVNQKAESKLPPRQSGTMKGTVLYMAPDFDAPLEDFKEYIE
jgi:hypothetical protein